MVIIITVAVTIPRQKAAIQAPNISFSFDNRVISSSLWSRHVMHRVNNPRMRDIPCSDYSQNSQPQSISPALGCPSHHASIRLPCTLWGRLFTNSYKHSQLQKYHIFPCEPLYSRSSRNFNGCLLSLLSLPHSRHSTVISIPPKIHKAHNHLWPPTGIHRWHQSCMALYWPL